MNKELKTDGCKFTFLCGHDSNIASVLAALDVEEYELPNSIEKKTLDNPPEIFPLHLKGLQQNADGLYLFKDVQQRFQQAIDAYDKLPQDKAGQQAA